MNADDIDRWCRIEYGDSFTTDEIEHFVGECLAMNADPRKRPRVVSLRRNPDGVTYAHRHTWAMLDAATQRFADLGVTAQWGHDVQIADPERLRRLGATEPGDIVIEIELTDTQDLIRYEKAVSAALREEIEQLAEKPTIGQRLDLRREIEASMGPRPQPRVTKGIGILLASTAHEQQPGRWSLSRRDRAVSLAQRDALDQRFPEVFAAR